MLLQVDENKMSWPLTLGYISQWSFKNIIHRSPLWGISIKMILSRAKPAIGGEKAEEKGGSAGRKQVAPHMILFSSFPHIILTSSSISTLWCCIHLRVFLVGHVSVRLIRREKYHLLIWWARTITSELPTWIHYYIVPLPTSHPCHHIYLVNIDIIDIALKLALILQSRFQKWKSFLESATTLEQWQSWSSTDTAVRAAKRF